MLMWHMLLVLLLLLRVGIDISFKASLVYGKKQRFILRLIKSPFAWTAYVLMASNMVLWTILLNYYPLSFIFPLFSISYVLIMLAGGLWFSETLDCYKYVGMSCILVSAFCLIFL